MPKEKRKWADRRAYHKAWREARKSKNGKVKNVKKVKVVKRVFRTSKMDTPSFSVTMVRGAQIVRVGKLTIRFETH